MNGKVVIGCELNTKELEKDLKNSEKELQKYEKEAEKLTEAKAKIEIDLQEYEKQKQLIQEATNEELKLASTMEQTNWVLETEQAQLEQLNQKYSTQFQKLEEINGKIENNAISQSMLNNKIQETSQKIKQVKGFEKIKTSIDDVNKGLSRTIKKVAKWGLALFGIRTAYNVVRNAMSTLSQYDDQMASNIQYITYALANTLKPVIETILNLVVKLLQYINYIVKAWTGKNLFKTADAFKNAQKGAKGLNKELQKTTASFDEINTVGSQSTSAGGSADISAPNIDLTGIQGEIPAWLQWIVDNKDLVISGLLGIAGGLVAIQLGLSPLMGLGIGLALAGIVFAIESLLAYLNDPSWENFGKTIQGVGIAIIGIGILIGSVPTIIVGAMILIVGTIIKYWDKIKEFLQNGIDWLKTKGRDLFEKIFGGFLTPLYDAFVNNLQLFLNFFDSVFTNVKNIFDNIIGFIKNVFAGNWKGAWENIKNIFISIFNIMKAYFTTVFNWIKNIVVGVAKTVGNILASVFKAVVNGVMGAIETILNAPIKAINGLIKVINKVPGIDLGTLSTFKLPRLAKGGIINQPGRGVPVGYGQATGGERGQEGVLPLTDSQQMALLGEAIGKYVRIDNVIDVNMDSRRINRILQSSSNRTAFASNR